MEQDYDIWQLFNGQDKKVMQQPPNDGDFTSEHSLFFGLRNHKYLLYLLAILAVTLTLLWMQIRSVRHGKKKQQRPPSFQRAGGDCQPLRATMRRVQELSSINFTTSDKPGATRPKFRFWKSQTKPSPRQKSAERSKLAESKNSQQLAVSWDAKTAAASPNKRGHQSNSDVVLVNHSANKAIKVSEGESQIDTTANVIMLTKSKTQLKPKFTSKRAQSFDQTANIAGKEGILSVKNRNTSTSLTQDAGVCDVHEAKGFSIAPKSKHEGGSDCRKCCTADTGDGTSKLPALAIDKFREINCYSAAERNNSKPSSQNYAGSQVKGYDSKTKSDHQTDAVGHETQVNEQTNGGHSEERLSQVSIEDSTKAIKLSLRDEQRAQIRRHSRKIRDEASRDSKHVRNEQNVKSDSLKSDSVMSMNETDVNLLSRNLCQDYRNIQQEIDSFDSRMCASKGCRRQKKYMDYAELHEVEAKKKPSQRISNGAEKTEHTVQTYGSRSPGVGSISTSDDRSWSFTRRNPVFEDLYTSFMKVSSLSKKQSGPLRRTIEVEPRPSKKLIVPRSRSEKQRFHSEQWPDEVLHNKDKVPKLACLLLDPDDYLLKNGRHIGAQKVYTKDGFKFIVPLTFVSYGDRTERSSSLADQPQKDVGFSLTNLSADDGSNCEVVGANCGNISQGSFEGNLGRFEKRMSTNICRSSSHVSSIREEKAERECGPGNYSRKYGLSGIVKTKQCDLRSFQTNAKRNDAETAELLSALHLWNSKGQTKETKIKKMARSSDVSTRICRERSEKMNASDRTPNIKDIIRKGRKRKEVELPLKHLAQIESMKNVSKWLSDIYSCRSHHSNSTPITKHCLKWQEVMARKQSQRTDSVPHKDFTSPNSGNCHLQGLKKDSILSHHRVAHNCITPSTLGSHLTRKRLALDVKNSDDGKSDKGTSHSDSSLSVACPLIKRSFARFMNRSKAHIRGKDETHFPGEGDCRYNSEVISDLEKDTNDVSTKHSIFTNKEIQHHQYRYLDVGDTKMGNKKFEHLQKPFTKLNAKQAQDHFQYRRSHQNKNSQTDSFGDTSFLGSVPVSCKSGEKLASTSPAYTHIPLFKNKHNESVNIIVRLESSVQKNLIEKHTFGSFLSATATPENSCLQDDPDTCYLTRKDWKKSEIPITDSRRRCILKQADLISGNKDAQPKVFGGERQLREITQTNLKNQQMFIDTAVGDSHGQFRLHCAVLSTDRHGLMSVKKFEGNIQEENTVYINDLSESKEQSKALEDHTNPDLSSDPSSIQLNVKRGNAQGKMTTAVTQGSRTRDLNMLYETNPKGSPTHTIRRGSNQANPKHLSIDKPKDSVSCRNIAQSDRTFNTKLLSKFLQKENKLPEHAHVSYGNNPEELAKDLDPGSKVKATIRARAHRHQAGVLVNCRLQKQEKKIQNEDWDIHTQQQSELLGEGEMKVAASKPCVMNTMDRFKIATESHLKRCRADNASEITNVLARNCLAKNTQIHSDRVSKELTEDHAIEFPDSDSDKQTNIVTINKRVCIAKQPLNYKSKHLQQERHIEEQYPEQNIDIDLLNKTKATTAGNVSTIIANTTSRRVDPCEIDRKTLENVPKEENARPNAAKRGQFNEQSHSSRLLHTTGNSDCRGVPQKRQKPQTDRCITSAIKENSNTTQKERLKLSESTDTKEINRCETFTGDLGVAHLSPVFKSYCKKETTEKLEDINITYSKENNIPHANNSSDISLNSQHFPRQKQTYRCGDEDTTQTNNLMDPSRCEGKKRCSSSVGRLISQRQKRKTLTATIQEPNANFQKATLELSSTLDCSPVRKQAVLKKARGKSESPKNGTIKSIQFDENVYFPQCPKTTSTGLSSKQKAEVSLFSQSIVPETGKSFCKVSPRNENSLTYNADKMNTNDGTIQSKAKIMKGKPTNRKPTNTKENENTQETTIKANRENSLPACGANISQYWQESNVKHQFARPRFSSHDDSAASGVDGCTRCNLKKPSNLQHVLFKKMFKFCAGEDATYAPEQQSEATSALRTSQTTNSKTKTLRDFNGLVTSGNPNNVWIVKEFPETTKKDKLRENKSGHDGQAGPQHLQKTRVSKNVKCVQEDTSVQDGNSRYFADMYTKRHMQSSVERGKNDEPAIRTCADNVFDETDDCCLPDHLPSKIGGSTDASSDDKSDLGSIKSNKQLDIVDDHKPTCHLNVDELREKYLREMTQKGLCRNRTFRIKDEKNRVHDKDVTVTGSSNQGTFSNDTTIIKSPMFIQSTNIAILSKTVGFYTPDICCSGSQSSLKRNQQDDEYEQLNVGKKITTSDKSMVDLSHNDKCILKDIPKRINLTGSDYERLPKTTLQNNEVILNSPISVNIKQNACDNTQISSPHSNIYSPQPEISSPQSNIYSLQPKVNSPQSNIYSPQPKINSPQSKIYSPQSKTDVSMKKQCGSRGLGRFYSPITQQKSDTSQAEHHRDTSELIGLRRQGSISNSNSPSSTSANIPIMENSELLSQTILTSPAHRTKNGVVAHVNSQAEDNPLSSKENCPSQAGQQEHTHQISTSQGPQKSSMRRPSLIPKIKRSKASFSRMERSDAQGCSQIRLVLHGSQKATTAGNSNSMLETISFRQPRTNETHSSCQSLNDTNKTSSEKRKQQKEVNNIRSPGSSTDVIISWFEKENVHETCAQESDTEPVFSFHNKPQSTMSHTPSNYTLTTVCGFQGNAVPMPNTPSGIEGAADINKQLDAKELIPSPRRSAKRVFDSSKKQENKEQVSERIRRGGPLENTLSENINVENLNEEFVTRKEDNKIPFWQKGSKSISVKSDYADDKVGVSGKKTATSRAMESKYGLMGGSRSDRHSCKVESLVNEFDGKSPVVKKEKIGTRNRNLQESELKKPGDSNVALNSRLRTMRGLAKNRKYVNSALMYTMKKQSVNHPYKPNSGTKQSVNHSYKPNSGTKQQHAVLKNPALSTNNSAVFDKGDFQLRYQIPTNAQFYNCKSRTAKPFDETLRLRKTVHKYTAASKARHKQNQNAIYFHPAYQPSCRTMGIETAKLESVSGHSLEGYTQGSIDSFNGNPAAKRFESQQSKLSATVPFCVQRGDAKDTDVLECSQDAQNNQEDFEDNGIARENTDDQIRTVITENDRANGSVCTASDSCKVSFDWYRPLATSAQACEHTDVPMNGRLRRGLFERRNTESDNSAEGSHGRQLFLFNARTKIGGEEAHGTSLDPGTKPVSQVSFGIWDPWSQQGMTQAHIQNSRHTVRPNTTYANRRDPGEETRLYTHLLAQDSAQANMGASGASLFSRPRQLLPFDVSRHPQNYFQNTRMNEPVRGVWPDLHKSHPSRSCHTSDAAPLISDSRRHYMSNAPYSGARHHRKPEDPGMQAPAEDASLSNLNDLYEHLQHNYNQANAVYHSNWVLANQNNSLNNLKETPSQFNCWTNSKSNVVDPPHHLLRQQIHPEQLHKNFTRTHVHNGYQNIASNDVLPQIPSNDDPYVQFGHIISNNSAAESDLCESRMQQTYSQQSQNFLTTGSNSLDISSHQQMPVNMSRMFPIAPARLPVSFNNQPTWQHLHQPLNMPRSNHNFRHVYPPTLPLYPTLENQQSDRRCLDVQPMPVLRCREYSDSSNETAKDGRIG